MICIECPDPTPATFVGASGWLCPKHALCGSTRPDGSHCEAPLRVSGDFVYCPVCDGEPVVVGSECEVSQ